MHIGDTSEYKRIRTYTSVYDRIQRKRAVIDTKEHTPNGATQKDMLLALVCMSKCDADVIGAIAGQVLIANHDNPHYRTMENVARAMKNPYIDNYLNGIREFVPKPKPIKKGARE